MWNYFLGWLEATGDEKCEVIRGAIDHFSEDVNKERVISTLEEVKTYLKKEHKHVQP